MTTPKQHDRCTPYQLVLESAKLFQKRLDEQYQGDGDLSDEGAFNGCLAVLQFTGALTAGEAVEAHADFAAESDRRDAEAKRLNEARRAAMTPEERRLRDALAENTQRMIFATRDRLTKAWSGIGEFVQHEEVTSIPKVGDK